VKTNHDGLVGMGGCLDLFLYCVKQPLAGLIDSNNNKTLKIMVDRFPRVMQYWRVEEASS